MSTPRLAQSVDHSQSDQCRGLRLRRVLWIDDEIAPSSSEVAGLCLAGFDVECAATGKCGIASAELREYAAILLDLRLPDQSGIDVLDQLSHTRAPILVLTGFGDIDSSVRAMRLGAHDFLQKPVDIDDLVMRLMAIGTRPRDNEPSSRLSVVEWLRIQTDRMEECTTRAELIALATRMLVNRRLTLRYVPGCAAALHVAFQLSESASGTPYEVSVLKREMALSVRMGMTQSWPADVRLLEGLTQIEANGRMEHQETFACHFRLSRAYLSRRLSKETNRSPSQWARLAALWAALRDVVQSTEAISQIAYARGWQHHSQFDDDFVRLFGTAPRDIRRAFAQRGAI